MITEGGTVIEARVTYAFTHVHHTVEVYFLPRVDDSHSFVFGDLIESKRRNHLYQQDGTWSASVRISYLDLHRLESRLNDIEEGTVLINIYYHHWGGNQLTV